jgi:hypothetical protein
VQCGAQSAHRDRDRDRDKASDNAAHLGGIQQDSKDHTGPGSSHMQRSWPSVLGSGSGTQAFYVKAALLHCPPWGVWRRPGTWKAGRQAVIICEVGRLNLPASRSCHNRDTASETLQRGREGAFMVTPRYGVGDGGPGAQQMPQPT